MPKPAVVVQVQTKPPGEEERMHSGYCRMERSTDSWGPLCMGEPAPFRDKPAAGTGWSKMAVAEPPRKAAAMGRHGHGDACLGLKKTGKVLGAWC